MNRISHVSSAVIRFQASRKFTQQELEDAVVQMNAERNQEAEDASRVAQKLGQYLGGDKKPRIFNENGENARFGYPWNNPAMPVNYKLVIDHSQYDAGAAGYIDVMRKIPGMKVLSGATNPQNRGDDFEWDISGIPEFANIRQKIFRIRFLEYDAHFAGW